MMIRSLVQRFGPAMLLVACASAPPSSVSTPSNTAAATARASDFGVVLMAHGGTAAWNEAVLEAVKPLRAHHDIEVAFGMAEVPALQDAVARLEARNVRRIGVVRLFVSGESFVDRTEKILGLRGGAPSIEPPPTGHAEHGGAAGHGGHNMATYRVATHSSFALSGQGLLDAEGMGTVLADRAAALSKTPAREDVLILGHGPGDDAENARWLAKLDARAAGIRARAAFRRVQVETLREDWPDKRAEAQARIRAFVQRAVQEGGTAIVIPFRVQGFGPYAEVLDGLDYVADKQGLIPHPEVTKWIEHEISALEAGPFRSTLPAE
jgi:sirohydrochlorin ferrochelatase